MPSLETRRCGRLFTFPNRHQHLDRQTVYEACDVPLSTNNALDVTSFVMQNQRRSFAMSHFQSLFEKLETRRRELGLSQSALAERSGVSLPTIQRILGGHSPAASFENTVAIAEAMGMQLDAVPVLPAEEVLEQQARKKAERLVGMVQGTSALEAQGVSSRQLGQMLKKTVQELLAGSRRRLWAE